MAMFDTILEHVLRVEIALCHACCRLQAGTDGEALHDLRIQLRRLRSLLRPLRKIDSVGRLDSAAAQLGKLTTPVRDLEVLIGELESRGHGELAAPRRTALVAAYGRVLRSREWARLQAELDAWPGSFRLERMVGDARRLGRKVDRRLERQIARLSAALDDPQFDPHRLRILVKHTRYMLDAYPRQAGVAAPVVGSLRAVQSALGSWHDLYQWCRRAEAEPDLQALLPVWRRAAGDARRAAEAEVARLRRLLAVGKRHA